MNDDKTLDALTNQRVTITLGGKTYSARRATLFDAGAINRYVREKRANGDDANIDLDASLYILCELIKPDVTLTPEQLSQTIPFTSLGDVQTALDAVGFIMPQLPDAPAAV